MKLLVPIRTLTDTPVQRKSNIWHKHTDTKFGHVLRNQSWQKPWNLMERGSEGGGTRVRRWRAPKLFSTYSYIETWTKKLATYFVENIWHKKSVYVRSGTSMKKAISKWWDWINSTVQLIPQWWNIRKILTRKPTTRMVYLHIPSSKIPKNSWKVCPAFFTCETYCSYADGRRQSDHLCRKGMFSTGEKKCWRAPLDQIEGCGVSAIRGRLRYKYITSPTTSVLGYGLRR